MLLRSIRTRLLGLVLATVVPLTAVIGVGLTRQWHRDQSAAFDRAVDEARLLAAQVDDHIGNLTNVLTGLSAAVSTDPADTATNDVLLRRAKGDMPEFVANIMLFAADGRNIGHSLPSVLPSVRFSAADREFFQQALAGQALAIGAVRISPVSARWVITVARPVVRAGRVEAVIAIGTLLERFQNALRIQRLPPGSVVRVVNENGIVVAYSVDSARWVGRDLGADPHVARYLQVEETSPSG